MSAPPEHVIIIGGGLGGTALAIALALRNIKSTIYEVRPERGTMGGAIQLAPNALRVLDRLGVYDRIKDQGFQYENMHFISVGGGRIGEVTIGGKERFGYNALRIKRTLLLKALHEQATLSGVEFRFSKKAVRVEEDDASATVFFADGTHATSSLIVGYDGLHSQLRASLLPSISPRFSGLVGIAGNTATSALRMPSDAYELPLMIFGRGSSVGMFPHNPAGDEVGCFATCEFKADRTREEWVEFERKGSYQYIRDRHQDWPEPVKSMMDTLDPDNMTIWPQYELPEVPQWHTRHVVLAGDAIHAMPPSTGQGAAQAFEDASLLSRALSLVSPSYSLSQALDQWEEKRRERVRYVVGFTRKSGDARREASWFGQVVREWGMWAVLSFTGKRAYAPLSAYDPEDVVLGPA